MEFNQHINTEDSGVPESHKVRQPDHVPNGILELVGNTPLVGLQRILDRDDIRVLAKMEMFNPGGSIKDRPAISILKSAMARGDINSETVVVESSSGNFGVGLAQACCYLGLNFICVLDARSTGLNISILKSYGARVEVITKPDPESGEFLQACINRVKDLLEKIPNAFWPNQHANEDNPKAHLDTMREICGVLERPPDYLLCATSTCGTLRGCYEYARRQGMDTKIYAVDAEGSLIFDNKQGKRIVPGHGAGRRPAHYKPELAERVLHVSALESIRGCRKLLKREAILAGGSSGGLISALERLAPDLPAGATAVVILCDRGERYMDTVYCDDWVRSHYPDFEESP